MFSIIVVFFTKFMVLYRMAKVLRKGYSTICKVYVSDMRSALKKAVDNPDETWDDKLMYYMDKIFKYSV